MVELDCWSSSSSSRGGIARALRQKKELKLELGIMEEAKLDIGEHGDRNLRGDLILSFFSKHQQEELCMYGHGKA